MSKSNYERGIMEKEIITLKQSVTILIIFILGSSVILGVGNEAGQDAWIAILIAMITAVPFVYVYSRILSNFPGKDLYEILMDVFGNIFGRIMIFLFVWFSFHLGALVIRNFTEFIKIVSLPETPQYVIAILMVLSCIWAVKSGIEVLGRWSSVIFPIIYIVTIVVTFLFIPHIKLKHIKPILYDGIRPVLNSAFTTFAFPFAETVIFTSVLNNLKNKNDTFKAYFIGLIIGGTMILFMTIRDIVTIGIENISIMYFPAYTSLRLINVADFLQRIEVAVGVVFLFGGFVKISVCLYSATKGFARIFNLDDYKQIAAPVGLLMMILSIIVYKDTMEMFYWASNIYKYYAMPFEIILPLFTLIVSEVKIRLVKRKASGGDK